MLKRVLGAALIPALLLTGCGNPAEDKPEARVGDAKQGGSPAAQGQTYVFAEGSTIGFVGSKVTGKHDGGFNSFTGTFNLVDDDPTKSSVEVEIDATSLWADNDRLTGHLKSADFFDVESHPTVHFTSTSIASSADGYTVTGNLSLHGVTKSISFPASITVGADRVTTTSEFFIKRFDFNIEYKGKADDLIRDEVVVKLNIVAKPAAAAS